MKIVFSFDRSHVSLSHVVLSPPDHESKDTETFRAIITTGDIDPTGRAFLLTRKELAYLVESAIDAGAIRLKAE